MRDKENVGRGNVRVVAVIGLFLVACSSGSEREGQRSTDSGSGSDLSARIENRLDGLEASSSLYAKHLPSGREIAVRADRPMNTLSVIKIPVMVQAFRDAASGRLDLDTRYPIGSDDMRRGSGLIQTFSPGLNPTLRGLVTQMIITSDNTATDMVIEAVGMARVNQLLEAEGYAQTRFEAHHRRSVPRSVGPGGPCQRVSFGPRGLRSRIPIYRGCRAARLRNRGRLHRVAWTHHSPGDGKTPRAAF